MDKKYFDIYIHLVDGNKVYKNDVISEDVENVFYEICEITQDEYITMYDKDGVHHKIYTKHIVQVVTKEVLSPEERKEKHKRGIENLRRNI